MSLSNFPIIWRARYTTFTHTPISYTKHSTQAPPHNKPRTRLSTTAPDQGSKQLHLAILSFTGAQATSNRNRHVQDYTSTALTHPCSRHRAESCRRTARGGGSKQCPSVLLLPTAAQSTATCTNMSVNTPKTPYTGTRRQHNTSKSNYRQPLIKGSEQFHLALLPPTGAQSTTRTHKPINQYTQTIALTHNGAAHHAPRCT